MTARGVRLPNKHLVAEMKMFHSSYKNMSHLFLALAPQDKPCLMSLINATGELKVWKIAISKQS